MSPGRLFGLVVVLAALAGLLVWLTGSEAAENGTQEVRVAETPLTSGNPADLVSFTISHTVLGLRLRIERGSESFLPWLMTEPIRDNADPITVHGALERLYGSDWKAAPADWAAREPAELGLDPARMVVESEFADGSRTVLRIGAPTLQGGMHAAEREGVRIQVGLSVVRFLERHASDWRDHRLIPNGLRVRRLTWTPLEGETITLERVGAGWHMTAPVSAAVDAVAQASIQRLLGARCIYMADEEISEKERSALAAGGRLELESPAGRIALLLKDNYAWLEGRPYLLGIAADDFQILSLPPERLLSQRLLTLQPGEVVSAWVTRGAEETAMRRVRVKDSGRWEVRGGEVLDLVQNSRVDFLVEFACTVERGESAPRPARPPAGSIRVSRSHGETRRGTELLQWWVLDDGTQVVATQDMQSAMKIRADLDTSVRLFHEGLN